MKGHHYRIQPLCRVPVTLGKGQFALGKLFAECNTRQTPLGKHHSAKPPTAQWSLPSVGFRALGKDFAECQDPALGKLSNLCRVLGL